MLVGYMRISKADGSQVTTCNAMLCSPPASMTGIYMKTPPPASGMTGPA